MLGFERPEERAYMLSKASGGFDMQHAAPLNSQGSRPAPRGRGGHGLE